MKKNALDCLMLLALLSGGKEAQAQAPGGRAQVYPVPTTGEVSRFQVPQVRLPDAAVARRINELLLREFRERIGLEVDSARSLPLSLGPAAAGRAAEAARRCGAAQESPEAAP